MKYLFCMVAIAASLASASTTALAAPPDPFTGLWVLDDGDGSTSRWAFAAPGADGVRQVTLSDTYATFCETAGQPGSGSRLTANGTAVDNGTTISITIDRVLCTNGDPGVAPPPIAVSATLANGKLDFGGGFLATRVGKG